MNTEYVPVVVLRIKNRIKIASDSAGMGGGFCDEENKIYGRWGHVNDTKKFVFVGNIILRVRVPILRKLVAARARQRAFDDMAHN